MKKANGSVYDFANDLAKVFKKHNVKSIKVNDKDRFYIGYTDKKLNDGKYEFLVDGAEINFEVLLDEQIKI